MEDTEPTHHEPDLWSAYLSFYRDQVIDGVLGLSPERQRTSTVPSGWAPIELLSHVLHMEQRWFVWGFLGEAVDDVWGDWTIDNPWQPGSDGRWHVPPRCPPSPWPSGCERWADGPAAILAEHPADAVAPDGVAFDGDPPTLGWICFHVLQEYARHAGHLDVAIEIGAAGEQ